jgi:hypothetical protein
MKYYIKKSFKKAVKRGKHLADFTIGTTENDYNRGKWIEITQSQAEFYSTHPNASFEEIINMQMNAQSYSELVSKYIHERYSIDEEIAIVRQREEKKEKFNAYYSFCEECKVRAKQELGINE